MKGCSMYEHLLAMTKDGNLVYLPAILQRHSLMQGCAMHEIAQFMQSLLFFQNMNKSARNGLLVRLETLEIIPYCTQKLKMPRSTRSIFRATGKRCGHLGTYKARFYFPDDCTWLSMH